MAAQPIIESHESFKIIGVERYTEHGIDSLTDAWNELSRLGRAIPHRKQPLVVVSCEDYSRGCEMKPDSIPLFYYIAALEVESLDVIPEGMVGREIPPATYAIFHYEGATPGISAFFRYIYDEWLPQSGYILDPNILADFERPQPHVHPETAIEDIWIPIVEKL